MPSVIAARWVCRNSSPFFGVCRPKFNKLSTVRGNDGMQFAMPFFVWRNLAVEWPPWHQNSFLPGFCWASLLCFQKPRLSTPLSSAAVMPNTHRRRRRRRRRDAPYRVELRRRRRCVLGLTPPWQFSMSSLLFLAIVRHTAICPQKKIPCLRSQKFYHRRPGTTINLHS